MINVAGFGGGRFLIPNSANFVNPTKIGYIPQTPLAGPQGTQPIHTPCHLHAVPVLLRSAVLAAIFNFFQSDLHIFVSFSAVFSACARPCWAVLPPPGPMSGKTLFFLAGSLSGYTPLLTTCQGRAN